MTLTNPSRQRQQGALWTLEKRALPSMISLLFLEMQFSCVRGFRATTSGSIHCASSRMMSPTGWNIAATSSPDSTHGLFQERWSFGTESNLTRYPVLDYELGTPSAPGPPVYVRQAHYRDHDYVRNIRTDGRLLQAPLMDRAWLFQELLLARRTFHVCASELIWECKSLCACECGFFDSKTSRFAGRPMSPALERSQLVYVHRKQQLTWIQENRYSTREIHDFWLKICEQYSTLLLTRPSDRSAALTGLANAVERVTNGKCVAGIWMEDLPRALLWYGEPRSSPKALRSSDAPTWSWMSRHYTDGSCIVTYSTLRTYGFRQGTKTSINVSTETNPVEITFQGPTISAKLRESSISYDPSFCIQVGSDSTHSSDSSSSLWADCPMTLENPLREGDMVECLLLGENDERTFYHALVVRKCFGMDGGFYERIGISRIDSRYAATWSYLKNAEIREIKII